MTQDWDAKTYHRVAQPQEEWGRRIIARLPLKGHETVADAGCGSGRITKFLLERLPRGRIIGVDSSKMMLDVARDTFKDSGVRVTLCEGDLLNFALPGGVQVDGVFSNATFHWIADHAALFANLLSWLRPRGWLIAQCGGVGNIDAVHADAEDVANRDMFAAHIGAMHGTWNFATAEATRACLTAVGFTDIVIGLEPSPQVFANRVAYGEFLKAVILKPYFARLPSDLHTAFVEANVLSAEQSGRGYMADYVRLNIEAWRP